MFVALICSDPNSLFPVAFLALMCTVSNGLLLAAFVALMCVVAGEKVDRKNLGRELLQGGGRRQVRALFQRRRTKGVCPFWRTKDVSSCWRTKGVCSFWRLKGVCPLWRTKGVRPFWWTKDVCSLLKEADDSCRTSFWRRCRKSVCPFWWTKDCSPFIEEADRCAIPSRCRHDAGRLCDWCICMLFQAVSCMLLVCLLVSHAVSRTCAYVRLVRLHTISCCLLNV